MAEQHGPDTCNSLTQHMGRGCIALLSEGGLCLGGTAEWLADDPKAENWPDGSVAWNAAVNFVGTTQRVCGPLARTGNSNDDVLLDLGRPGQLRSLKEALPQPSSMNATRPRPPSL